MPDIDELRRRHEAAREYSTPVLVHVAGQESRRIDFQMRLPVRLQAANAATRAARHDPDGKPTIHQIKRELLLVSLIGWTGVLSTDIDGTSDAEDLPYSLAAASLLLDVKPEWETALWDDYARQAAERQQRLEDAAKNSSAASSGSDPAPVRPPPEVLDSAP